MKVSPDKILEIKSRIDIRDLISEYVTLKKQGSNLVALCPFHHEKTPSFSVNLQKQFYHCFGCGVKGDIFTFIENIDKMTFPEALQKLAHKANVKLEDFSDEEFRKAKEKQNRIKELYRINELTLQFFIENLSKNKNIEKSFLDSRALTLESIKEFKIGYALSSWDSLSKHLYEKKVDLNLANELGLIRRKNDNDKLNNTQTDYYDMFRHRIVFPIISPSNEVLGFSCRKIDETENGPKYINSPESEVYHKRDSLFGLNVAKNSVNENNSVILVEGNIDCMALSSRGIKNVVATLGTALTSQQVMRLKRYTQNITLVYDGDNAGLEATKKALDPFTEVGIMPKTVLLTNKEDPDSFIKNKGREEFEKLLKASKYLLDLLIEIEMDSIKNPSPIDKANIYNSVSMMINKIKDPIGRESYYNFISKELGLYKKTNKPIYSLENPKNNSQSFKGDKAEETIVRLLLNHNLLSNKLITEQLFNEFNTLEFKEIGKEYISQISSIKESLNPESFNAISSMMMIVFNQNGQANLKELVLDFLEDEMRYPNDKVNEILNDCIKKIKIRNEREKIRVELENIKKAGNPTREQLEKVNELMKRSRELEGGLCG